MSKATSGNALSQPPAFRRAQCGLRVVPTSLVLCQVHTHAAGLDDPKLAGDRPALRESEEVAQSVEEARPRRWAPEVEHDDAGAAFGRKSWDLPEIAIQGDEGAPFGHADVEHDAVGFATKALVVHADRIMAALAQKLDTASADILIDLELHPADSTGTGMIRSRAASAP